MVTGASAGLGRALVRALVERGDVAIAVARRPDQLDETVKDLDPARILTATADVRDAEALAAIATDARARFGKVDGLFANAAIYPRGRIHEQGSAEALDVMAVNVVGVANSIRAVLPGMMRAAHGRIVVLGSFADLAPLADSWAYSASKGAIHALARAAAAEVAGDYPDILVNEWVPGVLRTDMGTADGIDPAVAAVWGLRWVDLPPGGPNGRMFSGETIVEPPVGLKRKLLRRVGLG
jgi:NAD(P)-dependent dehydrogenase (short-subunit alcohol dehydrogenase family)